MAVSFTPPDYSVVGPDVGAYRATVKRVLRADLDVLREDGLRPVKGLCPAA
jgi:hypothetical protein